jgi:NAD(P)-dependent dehydrogenase (short-subunit alcohol dehydrogenase family)
LPSADRNPGANSGVGYATAKIIAQSSSKYHVLVCARSESKGISAVSSLKSESGIKGSFSPLLLDVTSLDSIKSAFNTVQSEFGRLDVLINNAGIAKADNDGPIGQQIYDTMLTNVIGPNNVYDVFKPLLLKAPKAYLIHVTSGLGSIGMSLDRKDPSWNVPYKSYRITKAALNMTMAEDWKEKEKQGWTNLKVFTSEFSMLLVVYRLTD